MMLPYFIDGHSVCWVSHTISSMLGAVLVSLTAPLRFSAEASSSFCASSHGLLVSISTASLTSGVWYALVGCVASRHSTNILVAAGFSIPLLGVVHLAMRSVASLYVWLSLITVNYNNFMSITNVKGASGGLAPGAMLLATE